MAGTVAHVNKLPVWIVWGDTPANIGFCGAGDVTVTYTPTWTDSHSHQTGTYLLESYFNGARITVSATISETSVLAINATNTTGSIGLAYPMGEGQGDGTGVNRFQFTKIADVATNSEFIGHKASSIAQKLELIPVHLYAEDPTTETNDNLVIPKAFVRENGETAYSVENDLVIPVTWEALFVPGDAEGESLAWVGITTGTWTATTVAWA